MDLSSHRGEQIEIRAESHATFYLDAHLTRQRVPCFLKNSSIHYPYDRLIA